MSITWVFLLLAIGLFLLLAEVFIPSHGLLTVGALGTLGASVYFAFGHGPALGFTVIIVAVILLPLEIVLGVKLFPNTPIGKLMMLKRRDKTTDDDRVGAQELDQYVGKTGVTRTMCRPAGIAEIEGKRVDVVAEGMIIDAERPVTALRTDGNRLVVREKA